MTARSKKICIISPSAYPLIADLPDCGLSGGAEIQLVTLGFAFLKKGFSVDFVVSMTGTPTFENIKGVGVYRAPLKHLGMSNMHIFADILRFIRMLSVVNADIYLIKLPRHMLMPLGIFSKLFRKKVIFIGQVDADANKSKLKYTDSRIASFMYSFGLFCTNAIVAQTEMQKAGFMRRFKGDVRAIRNILTMDGEGAEQKDNYILWVGNSGKHKQPELFLALAAALPELRFRMIMSLSSQRPDDSFIRDELDNIPNLEYLGAVQFSEMSNHYKKASLLVSTSYSEGFPNVFLQAWQFETPTVSLTIDPDDVIKRFKLGVLSGTFDRLVEDVRDLMGNEELRREMGMNANKYAITSHSEESVVKQYTELFNSLCP